MSVLWRAGRLASARPLDVPPVLRGLHADARNAQTLAEAGEVVELAGGGATTKAIESASRGHVAPPAPATPVPPPTAPAELTVPELVSQVRLIQEAMREVMRDGEHYGVIPGTGSKPTLLKPGAEKLCLLFRLAPTFEEAGSVHKEGFIAYRIRCTLTHIPTGQKMGEGMGSCNSRERKYAKAQAWDIDNTLLKMACKRALVAAVLVATAASDIFTQDIEDAGEASARGAGASKASKAAYHAALNAKAAQLDNTLPRDDGQAWGDWSRDKAKEMFGVESRAQLDRDQLAQLIEAMDSEAVPF